MFVKWKARNEVFIVLFTPHYCQTTVAGVFSSKEKAEEYVNFYLKTFVYDPKDIFKIEKWNID